MPDNITSNGFVPRGRGKATRGPGVHIEDEGDRIVGITRQWLSIKSGHKRV